MTSQNEEAEELMRKIEKEEEQLAYDDPDRKVFHLCIVNLVIGTLYCAKVSVLCQVKDKETLYSVYISCCWSHSKCINVYLFSGYLFIYDTV